MNFSPNSAQNSQNSCNKFKPYILCLLATICIHWGIASYQPFIDTALILLCGGIIVILIDEKCSLKTALYKARFIIVSVGLAAISYKIVLDLLKKFGASESIYNNQITPLIDLPERILLAIQLGFKHLFTYDVPFMPSSMSVCFVLFVLVSLATLLAAKISKSAKVIIATLFVAMVLASQMHLVLANQIAIVTYIEYYGLSFLRVLVVVLCIKLTQLIRIQNVVQSLLFVLCAVFIWMCVVQDLDIQKTQKFVLERDLRRINRVVDRIEQQEDFSYDKQYCEVIIGGELEGDPNTIIKGFLWDTNSGYGTTEFYHIMTKDIFASCGIMEASMWVENGTRLEEFKSLIKRLDNAGILESLQPWPHKNSVVVFEDIIVIVTSEAELARWQQKAKEWRKE